jgi:hypothetical protein
MKIINETYQSDQNLPTLKQLEELKLQFEQLKNSKVDQTNEVIHSFFRSPPFSIPIIP